MWFLKSKYNKRCLDGVMGDGWWWWCRDSGGPNCQSGKCVVTYLELDESGLQSALASLVGTFSFGVLVGAQVVVRG